MLSQPEIIVRFSTRAALQLGQIRVGDFFLDWLTDRTFVHTRDAVLLDLKNTEYKFKAVHPVVFLCGAAESNARNRLRDYLKEHGQYNVFYAETAWHTIVEHERGANALDVEAKLGDLADIVAVIVESAGTLAELGAFAMSDDLRKKLLLILDERYRTDESFVTSGPVEWVDRDSLFRPSIWLKLNKILDSVDKIEDRLERLPKRPKKISEIVKSPKHLMFFVFDLVTVFGPASAEHISHLLCLLNIPIGAATSLYLGLGKALGLLRTFTSHDTVYFFRPLNDNSELPAFQRTKRNINIPNLRVSVVSAMQRCESGRRILSDMWYDLGTT